MNDVDLSRYINLIWKWLWLILISTALASGTAYRASKLLPSTYRAAVTVQVGDDVSNPNLSSDDVAKSQRIAGGYAAMVQRQQILEATAKALNLSIDWRVLRDHVLVSHGDVSQLVTIYVIDASPQQAASIANEIANQLIQQSPTAQSLQDRQASQQFVSDQLKELQGEIQSTEKELADKQAALAKETSARSILDDQDEIKALELKLTDWRSTYASLLTTQQVKPANLVTVIDPAVPPSSPVSPNVRTNVATAGAIGFFVALAAVLVIEYLNDSVETSDDVSRVLKLATLGSIQRMGRLRNLADGLVTVRSPNSPVSEGYRLVRTNILLNSVQEGLVPILVTSPGPNEGKSITSVNLAVSFANMGKRVVLVDADLRQPTIHRFFGATNEQGLTSLLAVEGEIPTGDAPRQQVETALLPTTTPELRFLPSGPLPSNPAELLASPRMGALLRALQELADVVILDSAPVLPVADTTILAGPGIAVVMVVEAGKTRVGAAREANQMLANARARMMGVVLNKAASSPLTNYDYRFPAAAGKRGA
jgi:capsular exopolysaccharide synthesis family protein